DAVDHCLHNKNTVRHARPSIWADNGRVGEDRNVLGMNGANFVRPRHDALAAFGNDWSIWTVGATVVVIDVAKRSDATVPLYADFHLMNHQSLMIGTQEVLGAIFNPFDRALQKTCRKRNNQLFGVKQHNLDAESAPDVRRNQVYVGLGHSELLG